MNNLKATEAATEIIQELLLACGSGMNWMEQVSRAKLGSATRGILETDMGMCSTAMFKARIYLEKILPLTHEHHRPLP
jgi:hypothetical protein